MPNLFNPSDVNELVNRISKLTPDAQRQWGKMNVSQMLAHCNKGMESAMGLHHIPRAFIGRILGPLFRATALSDKPFGKNSPTDKSLIFTGEYNLEEEKLKLIAYIQAFMKGGADGCTKEPHAFFGHFTPDQWALFQWKHLDHHLRQFGV